MLQACPLAIHFKAFWILARDNCNLRASNKAHRSNLLGQIQQVTVRQFFAFKAVGLKDFLKGLRSGATRFP
jgi:hypothetical protein